MDYLWFHIFILKTHTFIILSLHYGACISQTYSRAAPFSKKISRARRSKKYIWLCPSTLSRKRMSWSNQKKEKGRISRYYVFLCFKRVWSIYGRESQGKLNEKLYRINCRAYGTPGASIFFSICTPSWTGKFWCINRQSLYKPCQLGKFFLSTRYRISWWRVICTPRISPPPLFLCKQENVSCIWISELYNRFN